MADQEARFAVSLDTSEVEAGGASAAQAMQNLRDKIQGDVKSLAEMQRALRQLRGGTTANTTAISSLKDKIAAKKQAIADSQSGLLQMKDRFGDLTAATHKSGLGMGQFETGLQSVNNPIGGLIGKFSSLTALSAGLAASVALVVAAFVALAAGAAGAIAALSRYAVAVADARRTEMLHLEGLTKIPNFYGIAAGSATDLRDAIDEVSMTSAVGRDKIEGYARELYRMGMRGQNLKDALDATSIAASAAGEQYAGLVKNQMYMFGMLGGSTKGFADHIREQMGGIAAKQALGLSVQMRKLRENIARLFGDIKIDGFLRALNEVLSLFSQQTATGRALKAIIESAFGSLGGFFTGPIGLMGKRFFQGFVISALLVAIAVLQARNALRDAFGNPKWLQQIDWLTVALYGGMAAGFVFAASIAALTVAMGVLGVTTLVALTPLIALIAMVSAAFFGLVAIGYFAIAAFDAFGAAIDAFAGEVAGKGWENLGTNIINGILAGLRAGADKLIAAGRNLGTSIKDAFNSVLQINSPSRVMFRSGDDAGEGASLGLQKQIPKVRASSERLAEAMREPVAGIGVAQGLELQIPSVQPSSERMPEAQRSSAEDVVARHPVVAATAPRPAVGRGAARGDVRVQFGDIIVQGNDASDIARQVKDELVKALSGAAIFEGLDLDGLEPA